MRMIKSVIFSLEGALVRTEDLKSLDEELIETLNVPERYACPYSIGLLAYAKREDFRVGITTISDRRQACCVLEALGLENTFDVIATCEDVVEGGSDPGIYARIGHDLGVKPEESLVIEGSVHGIKAALKTGMPCIAKTSNITRQAIHESGLIEKQWIIDDPALLITVARQRIAEARLSDLVLRFSIRSAST